MKAFIAVMLVAAVSGQLTTGVDRNIMDLLRTRQVYPRMYNQQMTGGVYGDLTTVGQQQYLPSTQQFNIPSDYQVYNTNTFPTTLYTLRQLYTLPIFQEYLTLPLFRQYLTVPAFQQYLVSQYFQQYFTQTTFRQFFVEPALFYKYIFPVVLQYNQQIGTTYGYENQLVVPEIYVKYVPEIYRGLIPVVTRDVVPTIFQGQGQVQGQIFGDNVNTFAYGKRVVPNMYNYNTVFGNKNIVPETYNTELYGNGYGYGYNTLKNLNTVYPSVYGYGKTILNKNLINTNTFLNKQNIFDVLTGKVNTPLFNLEKVTPFTTGYETIRNTVPMTYNTNTFVSKTQETLLLEKIFKDLVEGKINVEDLKMNMEGQQLVNKIVDPITVTGDFKIVEDKMVKPIETVVEGELNKEALLNKVILKKQIFNKL